MIIGEDKEEQLKEKKSDREVNKDEEVKKEITDLNQIQPKAEVRLQEEEKVPGRQQVSRRPVEYEEYVREGYVQPEEVRDQERLFAPRRAPEYTIDDFRKLVQKTYEEPNDPFPYIDDLLKAYTKYKLDKYSKYLSEDNELNSRTSPSIDMGKAPHLFSYREAASQQIYHVPRCVYPHFVCIKYSEICPY